MSLNDKLEQYEREHSPQVFGRWLISEYLNLLDLSHIHHGDASPMIEHDTGPTFRLFDQYIARMPEPHIAKRWREVRLAVVNGWTSRSRAGLAAQWGEDCP